MANLTESLSYDAGVYQLETTDPVLGGAGGASNLPHQALANRTAYLKKHVDDIESGAFTLPGYALIASPTFTGDPKAPTPALGDNDTSIPTTAWTQATIGGVLSKSVAGGSNVTLTAVEAGNGVLTFTGTLTANINVIVPATPTRSWIVVNSTAGAFTLTVKTAAGTGVAVRQGYALPLLSNGTNVVHVRSDFTSIDLAGTPTATTATAGDSSLRIATTAFVQNAVASAGGTSLTSATPAAETVGAAGAVGVATTAARADHVHAMPGAATTGAAGFMSAADKTKLDGIATGAAALGSTVGAALAASATAGVATTAAKSDHVHPYPTPAQIGAASTGANTYTGAQTGGDNQLTGWVVKDIGQVRVDKGSVTSGTVTFDYSAAGVQRLQVGGALTIAVSNWPPTGNQGELLLKLINGGAFTITWPTINWVKSDGSTTTAFSSSGYTLQSSETDFVLLWTDDAGTTIFGKVVR